MKNDRLTQILNVIKEKQSVDAKTLMNIFYVSESTIRRDLTELENAGLILRSKGKAINNEKSANLTTSFMKRSQIAKCEKELIAKQAVSLCVKEGDVVMLDASSTAAESVKFLKNYKNVIVMTSGIETLLYLAQTDLEYYSSGGQAFNKSYSFIGQTAINAIKTLNADVCFVSCHGLSENGFVTDVSVFENDVRNAILNQSKRKVLLIDSTKINKGCYSNLCHISEFDDVFCNELLPKEILRCVKNFNLVTC